VLDGAAASWYFDGKNMHENFVLERSAIRLDAQSRRLTSPGVASSEFYEEDGKYHVKISAKGRRFDFVASQEDKNPEVGPVYGKTSYPFGMKVEGTRIEIMKLSGHEESEHGRKSLSGTAYFQKILLAAPPPPWYWGMYHFADGSFFTFMQAYLGSALFAKTDMPKLKSPHLPISSEMIFYHAPSGKAYRANKVRIVPQEMYGRLWRHNIEARGEDFSLTAIAEAYSHACWLFEKYISSSPLKSKFYYNEYPAAIKTLRIRTADGVLEYENGTGNMENSWGLML
jgi:hypothetical protein